MTLKNIISENDCLEIISQYNLGRFNRFKVFTGGATQTTVLIETSNGKYVLRYYKNRNLKHVLFEVYLLNYLKNNSFPAPAIIKTSKGSYYGIRRDKPLIIIEYVDGVHIKNPNEYFDKAQVSKVIEVTAKLHKITSNYHPEYLKYREAFDTVYAWSTYHNAKRKVDKEERAKWFKNELDKLKIPSNLPKCICHADLNYGNFLLRKGEISAVLDFDMSIYTYAIYDIANLIYWWTFPPKREFKEKEAAYTVKEYAKHRTLNETERRHVYDVLKLIILLGISWSEESDFEDSKRAIKYLNKLGRKGFYAKLFPHYTHP